jgi:hypothetical protein
VVAAGVDAADLVHHHVTGALEVAAARANLDVDPRQLVRGVTGLLDLGVEPGHVAVPDHLLPVQQAAARQVGRPAVVRALDEAAERRACGGAAGGQRAEQEQQQKRKTAHTH